MKQIKCSFILFVIVAAIFLLTTGCKGCIQFEPSNYDKNNMELYTIAAYSIPFADEMGTLIKLTEKDTYGRALFEVEFGNSLFYTGEAITIENTRIYAYVICQFSDKERTYYYEDECYRLYPSSVLFTESEELILKETNDWNKPLSFNKMTSRKIIRSGDSKLSNTPLGLNQGLSISMRLEEIFCKNYQTGRQHVFSEYLDCDNNGTSIGIIWDYSKKEQGEVEVEAYFIMVEQDCLVTNRAKIAEIHDRMHYWDELKQFKQENGWES